MSLKFKNQMHVQNVNGNTVQIENEQIQKQQEMEISKATDLLKKEISILDRIVHVYGKAFRGAISKK